MSDFEKLSRVVPKLPALLLSGAVLAAVPLSSGAARAQDAAGGGPVSSGLKVTGHGGVRTGARSKVSPSHPAPAEHVTQPSSKLHNDRNVVREQVAPIPDKPVRAPGDATTAPNDPGG